MTILEHPAVLRVRASLRSAGVSGEVVVLDEHARTAASAAAQLGVQVAQIGNDFANTALGAGVRGFGQRRRRRNGRPSERPTKCRFHHSGVGG